MSSTTTIEERTAVESHGTLPLPLSGFPRRVRRWIERPARPMDDTALKRSAVIVAPHQDDETLGCGGLVIHKRALGADVTIVYLSDGAQSHNGQVSPASLAEQRRREGVDAARVLGIGESDVLQLDHPDGSLGAHAEVAVAQVAKILAEREPEQVFVTSPRDVTPDHQSASNIVQSAMRQVLPQAELFAYPIWYWCYWPFARAGDVFDSSWPRRGLRLVRSVRAMHQTELLRLPLDGVREQKWAALNKHASQMHRDPDHPNWPTLGDVWDGGFLRCFFDENEIFVRMRN